MIKVNEVFYSIQGEGAFAGRPAVFIRLQGCPVGCTFCDTKHTWSVAGSLETSRDAILEDRGLSPARWAWIAPEELAAWVGREAHSAAIVVITGGEPLLQRDGVSRLVELLVAQRRQVQIETSGTVDHPLFTDGGLYGDPNPWITVSPKWGSKLPVKDDALRHADEIKVVVSSDWILGELFDAINRGAVAASKVRLQPETGPNFEWSSRRAVEVCKAHGFKLSLQTHTWLSIR